MCKKLSDFGCNRSLSFCAVTLQWVEFFLFWHENELLMALRGEVITKEIVRCFGTEQIYSSTSRTEFL